MMNEGRAKLLRLCGKTTQADATTPQPDSRSHCRIPPPDTPYSSAKIHPIPTIPITTNPTLTFPNGSAGGGGGASLFPQLLGVPVAPALTNVLVPLKM